MAQSKRNSKSSKNSASSKASGAKRKNSQPARRRMGSRSSANEAPAGILDGRMKRDIAGVVLIVLGIALFLAVVLPSDAAVTSFVSTALHYCLGVGSYIFPFILVAVGATFILKLEAKNIPVRFSIGFAIMFLAILSLIALFSPVCTSTPPDAVFDEAEMLSHAGCIGAAIAWAGVSLFGQVISIIIMIGVLIIGASITGFSVSSLVGRAKERARDSYIEDERENGVMPAPAYAPAVQTKHMFGAKTAVEPALEAQETQMMQNANEAASTQVLPAVSDEELAGEVAAARAESAQQALDDANNSASFRKPATQLLTRRLGRRGGSEAASSDNGSNNVKQDAQGAQQKTRKEKRKPKQKQRQASALSPVAQPSPKEGFELPSMSLLATTAAGSNQNKATDEELEDTAACLQEALEDFNIMAKVVGWVAGPTVTLFKVDLPAGVRVSRVTALTDDISLALAAPGVRIFAPIPGTNYVGIEVPNKTRQTVLLGDILKNAKPGPLQIAIGKDVEGHSIVSDLSKMPHLLIGGTTGSGKSVSINAMIMSILMRATPTEVRFIMVDPKRVEFTPYNGIPHLYVPVITEAKEAASALSWGVAEMERRLKEFSKVGARNIGQFNAKAQAEAKAAEKTEASAQNTEAENDTAEADEEHLEELPFLVIIIDELADLMMTVGKEVEFSISRLAQLGRAAGIHLIVATQRPSTNVVTGLIKANITNRIAFNVASGIDSRVVLDTPGAESLIGLGDLLLSKPEYAKPVRIQGCFVTESEINAVVNVLREQGEPDYHNEVLSTNVITLGSCPSDASAGTSNADDSLVWEAADLVVSSGVGSTSNIQRRLKVGYSRAGRIMDMLEAKGIVGPANGSKPREVLVDALELETLRAFEENDSK